MNLLKNSIILFLKKKKKNKIKKFLDNLKKE